MAASHVVNVFDGNKFNEILKNPETYFKSLPENINVFKELSQKSYSYASCNNINLKGKSLSKLFVNGFDDEQIWQQTDLLNKDLSSSISDLVQDFGINTKNNLINVFKNSQSKSPPPKKNRSSDRGRLHSQDSSASEEDFAFDGDSDSPSELNHSLTKKRLSKRKSKEEYAFDDDSDSPSELSKDLAKKLPSKKGKKEEYAFDDDSDSPSENADDLPKKQSSKKKTKEEYAFDDDSDASSEFSEDKIKQVSPKKKSKFKSVVDDQFFKLSKLEEYLKIEDIKEERGDENPSGDEIDLFQDIPSDDCDEDSGEDSNDESAKSKKSARNVMYDDFFDDPDSEIEDGDQNDDDDHHIEDENPDDSFDRTLSDADMENGTNEENDDKFVSENNVEEKANKKSAHQLEQERISKNIQEIEKNMLQPLSWQLTGEVAAASRPIDSLIHQDTEFDSNMVKDLQVDKDLTEKIEEITIKAIMNKAFSDVERKYKPTEEVINYKKEVALEQTKSKKSLAEVYEEDYLKKKYNQDTEEEDPKHKEIKKLMDTLFPQLHALFSHIPKPAVPEIKIVSNLPAITVEEVAPTSVSDATLLAPEEVKKKSGLVKGQTERTDTDRKRERRKKKIHQRLKEKKRMKKLEEQKGNPSAKVSKLEKIQTLKKLKQHKNTKIASVDEGGKIKSSKDFFSRLQDTVTTKRKADNKSEVSSKKKKK